MTNVEICNTSCFEQNVQLLYNNLSIVWNIKINLITFFQESPQMLFESMFAAFCKFAEKTGWGKCAWPS